MPRVTLDEKNLRHCRCPYCPVQDKSECTKKNAELKKDSDKLYCSTGKSSCTDLNEKERCICPTCLVWSEYDLSGLYYCTKGSADDNG
ncbi:hypothetical protein A2617_00125 [Candidatus Daviesbacteria bacterium RIFOXYD1_FULL_41_10]|uniref:DUF2769 domain-containing protein n=2 Tax=Candidatus Daviesiibacteriota TaxID=1752718 RepID=A0A1F5N143_9BACT|nr:MAG: hypothetical protein UU67_C0026G0015 [Candidatus Daviesbacteria bacterium GW2011_GWB1_41_5]OGE71334.1 MAG: hypothetical protein A2617_00125 [Candidatus Daviesbacteria bacterium RIFOXYD1_FULL_41_10]